jgi:hypothetical protein
MSKKPKPQSSLGYADRPGEIAVAVISSAETEHLALAGAKTWAKQFRNIAYFAESSLPQIAMAGFETHVIRPLDKADHVSNTENDLEWKTFSTLARLQQLYPDVEKYLLIEDGAFLVATNFMCITRTSFKPTDLVYAGFRCSTSIPEPSGWVPIDFIALASGIVLNRKVVTLLEPHLHKCAAWGQGIPGDVRLARCIKHVSNEYQMSILASTLPGVINTNLNQQITTAKTVSVYGNGLSPMQDLAVVFQTTGSLAARNVYNVEKLAHTQNAPVTFSMMAALFPAAQADPEADVVAHYPWQAGNLNTASVSCQCCLGVHTPAIPQAAVPASIPVVSVPLPDASGKVHADVSVPATVATPPTKVLLAHTPPYPEQPRNRRDLGYLMNLFIDERKGKLHPF